MRARRAWYLTPFARCRCARIGERYADRDSDARHADGPGLASGRREKARITVGGAAVLTLRDRQGSVPRGMISTHPDRDQTVLDLLVEALPHLRGGLRPESARFT